MTLTSLAGLSEAERDQALKHYDLIRPFLDERVPLTYVARDHGLALRTARRWVDCFRRHGLAGLAAGRGAIARSDSSPTRSEKPSRVWP